jgi:hypothetical protein
VSALCPYWRWCPIGLSTRLITYPHRYKRPPRKKKSAPLKVPAVVRRGRKGEDIATAQPVPANDDRRSSIVKVQRPRGRFGDAPDLTSEELQQRRDAADALFKELVRQATSGERD